MTNRSNEIWANRFDWLWREEKMTRSLQQKEWERQEMCCCRPMAAMSIFHFDNLSRAMLFFSISVLFFCAWVLYFYTATRRLHTLHHNKRNHGNERPEQQKSPIDKLVGMIFALVVWEHWSIHRSGWYEMNAEKKKNEQDFQQFIDRTWPTAMIARHLRLTIFRFSFSRSFFVFGPYRTWMQE